MVELWARWDRRGISAALTGEAYLASHIDRFSVVFMALSCILRHCEAH